MPRQYVAVQFHPSDRRTYTYHNDGEPVQIGDQVVVETPLEGRKTVEVVGIGISRPGFPTKPIVGIAAVAERDAEMEDER